MNEDRVSPEEQEGNDNVHRKNTEGLVRGSSHTKDQEGEKPLRNTPKAGISVANFNMAGNFDVSIAVNLMMDQNIHILAIQEHSPWGMEMHPGTYQQIIRVCAFNGFLVQVAKHQIIIFNKLLSTIHRYTDDKEEGHICTNMFQIGPQEYAAFIAVYGILHGKKKSREGCKDIAAMNRQKVRREMQ